MFIKVWRISHEAYRCCFCTIKMNDIGENVVTDRQTHTQTDGHNSLAHVCRGLITSHTDSVGVGNVQTIIIIIIKICKIEVMTYTWQVDSNIVWQDKKQRNEIKYSTE